MLLPVLLLLRWSCPRNVPFTRTMLKGRSQGKLGQLSKGPPLYH